MRVHFTSVIILIDVNLLLVDETNDLDVLVRLHELDTCESAWRNHTCTPAALGAPSYSFTLSVTDHGVGLWGSPEAEVIERVEEGSLTFRVLALGASVANVVTELSTTDEVVSVSLLRLSSE